MCVCVYFILSLRVFRAALFTRVNTCSLAERERVLEISDDERERGFVLKPFRVCTKKKLSSRKKGGFVPLFPLTLSVVFY